MSHRIVISIEDPALVNEVYDVVTDTLEDRELLTVVTEQDPAIVARERASEDMLAALKAVQPYLAGNFGPNGSITKQVNAAIAKAGA